MNKVKLAEKIARKAHEGQTRWDKSVPYITHPKAVANAFKEYKPWEEDEIQEHMAVAWLHDVIEDCNMTKKNLLEAGISERIAVLVEILSKDKNERYLDYILRVKENDIATEVKIEDIKHNMSTLIEKDELTKTRIQRYDLALYILEN